MTDTNPPTPAAREIAPINPSMPPDFYQATLDLLLTGNDKVVSAALSNNYNTIISALRFTLANYPGEALTTAAAGERMDWPEPPPPEPSQPSTVQGHWFNPAAAGERWQPDGWKLVPIVPTKEMIAAGNPHTQFDPLWVWEAMIEAVPPPPQAGP